MTDRFAVCLDRVLVHEGGFADHPDDPGGATMQGVTQRVYDAYRDRHRLPRQSVRHILRSELMAIYHEGYWLKVRADELPAGVDSVVFDAAVNSGPSRSAKWLQEAVGTAADGVIGPRTLAAVKRHNPVDIIERCCDIRMAFLRGLSHWRTFARGWTRRVNEVEDAALSDAEKSTPLEPDWTPPFRIRPPSRDWEGDGWPSAPVAVSTRDVAPRGFLAALRRLLARLWG